MASPMTYTSAWSAMVAGFVRKKNPSVMWKREREVRIVLADMRAMVAVCLFVRSVSVVAANRTATIRAAVVAGYSAARAGRYPWRQAVRESTTRRSVADNEQSKEKETWRPCRSDTHSLADV